MEIRLRGRTSRTVKPADKGPIGAANRGCGGQGRGAEEKKLS